MPIVANRRTNFGAIGRWSRIDGNRYLVGRPAARGTIHSATISVGSAAHVAIVALAKAAMVFSKEMIGS